MEFKDGYKLEIDATENQVTYQFITPDNKKAKKFIDRSDPRELTTRSKIGLEIKRHINEGFDKERLENEFEKILIELSDMVENIIIDKNEAHGIKAKAEESVMEEMIDEGYKKLQETQYPLIWIANVTDWLSAGERFNIMYSFLTYCSQVILQNPISVIAIGEGGSGKTHIIETALSLIPKEYVMTVKSTTEAALFGFVDENPYQFDGKIINIGDMGGKDDHQESQDFKNAMKELQSDGHMMRIKQVRSPDGEGWINKHYELWGNPCITYTNIPGYEFDDQELSRSILITPRTDNDEAVGEFKRIFDSKTNRTAINIQRYKDKIPDIQNMVRALRNRMDDVEIVNPYGNFIRKYLGATKYFKRDFDKYNGILKVVTALNGYNRPICEVDGHKYLFTTENDIKYFLDLLTQYHESITTNLSPGAVDVLKNLRNNAENWDLYDVGITINDFMYESQSKYAKKSIGIYFAELNRRGLVKVAGTEGRSNIYVLMESDFSKFKEDIQLTQSDKKVLKYNYDLENLEKFESISSYLPPETVWEYAPEPYWNDVLPKK